MSTLSGSLHPQVDRKPEDGAERRELWATPFPSKESRQRMFWGSLIYVVIDADSDVGFNGRVFNGIRRCVVETFCVGDVWNE